VLSNTVCAAIERHYNSLLNLRVRICNKERDILNHPIYKPVLAELYTEFDRALPNKKLFGYLEMSNPEHLFATVFVLNSLRTEYKKALESSNSSNNRLQLTSKIRDVYRHKAVMVRYLLINSSLIEMPEYQLLFMVQEVREFAGSKYHDSIEFSLCPWTFHVPCRDMSANDLATVSLRCNRLNRSFLNR
jgi:hypothetical protein